MTESPLQILVVDDIRRERAYLRKLIESYDAALDCTEAQDGLEALHLLQRERYDLIFLDIRMPGLSGIEVAWKIKELPEPQRPLVIFATAYDEYAKAGFDLNVVHYITKPYKRSDVHEAINRAIKDIAQNNQQQRWQNFLNQFTPANTHLPGLWASAEDDLTERLVLFGEIGWIHIDNKQIFLTACHGQEWVQYRLKHKSLKDVEAELHQPEFVRVSQSHIVNVHFILKRDVYGRSKGREIVLVMRDAPTHTSIVIGSTYMKALKGLLL